jgi:hypothetical protein
MDYYVNIKWKRQVANSRIPGFQEEMVDMLKKSKMLMIFSEWKNNVNLFISSIFLYFLNILATNLCQFSIQKETDVTIKKEKEKVC